MHSFALGHNPHVIGAATEVRCHMPPCYITSVSTEAFGYSLCMPLWHLAIELPCPPTRNKNYVVLLLVLGGHAP